jgi:Cu2+-exporting ATPase
LGTPEFVGAGAGQRVTPDHGDADGSVQVMLADEHGLLATFRFADGLRPDAAAAVADLRAMGLKVMLLSGDRPITADHVARALSIDSAEGGLLPEDKLARIKALQAQGAIVAMVGDGINDAPVLAGAQVSIAMGTGTQLAQSAADMVLLSETVTSVACAVRMARRTLTIIRENLAWAATYNAVALPLAASGWVAPWMAALGMSVSSLLVVVNALRLTTPTPQGEAGADDRRAS